MLHDIHKRQVQSEVGFYAKFYIHAHNETPSLPFVISVTDCSLLLTSCHNSKEMVKKERNYLPQEHH